MNKCNLFHYACRGLLGREFSRALLCKPKLALSAGGEPSTGTESRTAPVSAAQPASTPSGQTLCAGFGWDTGNFLGHS